MLWQSFDICNSLCKFYPCLFIPIVLWNFIFLIHLKSLKILKALLITVAAVVVGVLVADLLKKKLHLETPDNYKGGRPGKPVADTINPERVQYTRRHKWKL